jgi:hypothetical protein
LFVSWDYEIPHIKYIGWDLFPNITMFINIPGWWFPLKNGPNHQAVTHGEDPRKEVDQQSATCRQLRIWTARNVSI